MFVLPYQQSFDIFQHSSHSGLLARVATEPIVVSFAVESRAVCYSWDSSDSAGFTTDHICNDPTHTR